MGNFQAIDQNLCQLPGSINYSFKLFQLRYVSLQFIIEKIFCIFSLVWKLSKKTKSVSLPSSRVTDRLVTFSAELILFFEVFFLQYDEINKEALLCCHHFWAYVELSHINIFSRKVWKFLKIFVVKNSRVNILFNRTRGGRLLAYKKDKNCQKRFPHTADIAGIIFKVKERPDIWEPFSENCNWKI